MGLVGLSGCGRWGFDVPVDGLPHDGDDLDALVIKGDSPLPIDADPTIDAALGFGDYTVTSGTAAYLDLAGAQPVPGFAVGADDESYALPLPFPFTFYGIPFSTVNVSVNGFVTFGTPPVGSDAFTNDCPLDGTTPDAVIAVFWDDLFASATAPAGNISYAIGGTAPARWVAIEWKNLDAYYQAGGGNNSFGQNLRVTQQLVLLESNVIEMRYGPRTAPTLNRDCGLDRHRGCSATVGVEASGNTMSTTVQCGTAAGPAPGYAPIDDGRLITLTPR